MPRKTRLFIECSVSILIAFLLLYSPIRPSFDSSDKSSTKINTYSNQSIKAKGALRLNDSSKSFKGFTLFPVSGTAETLLLNMQGQVVHSWTLDAERARLLPNGNLLVIHGSKWGKDQEPWASLRNKVREYDWNGKLVWEHTADDVAHHDVHRDTAGNTLYLKRSLVPASFKENIHDKQKRGMSIRGDSIHEIDSKGKLLWEWHTYEHLDLNSCGRRECRPITGRSNSSLKARDWTHANTASPLPNNKWYKKGDQRFKPGNIVFLPRNWWTVFIIDKESGKVVWEYGGNYRGGISGGHEAHMIPEGVPGAGNILVLDNGAVVHRGSSFILEINPVTKEPVWIYDVGEQFWTGTRGSVQRLPNGNTFISEDNTGRAFEVTPQKEIVWEYKNEYQMSRAMRYPPDYCPQFHTIK